MKQFTIIRVPVVIGERAESARRPNFGPRPEIVGEADSDTEASAKVASLSFGDLRHHYYALELRFMGAPDRKSAIALAAGKEKRGAKPKIAVDNSKEKRV